jgi:hypothetical protein
MIKIGVNTDNWRHADKPVEYTFKFISSLGIKYCELEAVGGTEFFTGLGFAPFIPDSDPLELKRMLDRYSGRIPTRRSFPSTVEVYRLHPPRHHYASRWAFPTWILRMVRPGARLSDRSSSGSSSTTCPSACHCGNPRKINVEPHIPSPQIPDALEIVEHPPPLCADQFRYRQLIRRSRDPVKFLERVLPHVRHMHCKGIGPELAAREAKNGISAQSCTSAKNERRQHRRLREAPDQARLGRRLLHRERRRRQRQEIGRLAEWPDCRCCGLTPDSAR